LIGNDPDTLQFYANEAVRYANQLKRRSYHHLDSFLRLLPAGSSILELGCGSGDDTAYMLARGFNVTPTDGSPEIAAEAQKRLSSPVKVLLFHEIADQDIYDAVWASACLLHVPRKDLSNIIQRIQRALRAGGYFFASYKAGTEEGRDKFGRYFNYPSPEWLRSAYGSEGWRDISISKLLGSGYDKEPTEWLHVIAIKNE
jgi:SAM-dependent methyltransferase